MLIFFFTNLAGFPYINPAFSIIKLMCLWSTSGTWISVKHKPHLYFSYLRNTSLQEVKAIVNTKTVRRFVLTHQATQD